MSLGEQMSLWINQDISKYCCTKLWWVSVKHIQDFPALCSNNIERGNGKLNNTPSKKDWSTLFLDVLCFFSFSFHINFCWTYCFSRKCLSPNWCELEEKSSTENFPFTFGVPPTWQGPSLKHLPSYSLANQNCPEICQFNAGTISVKCYISASG